MFRIKFINTNSHNTFTVVKALKPLKVFKVILISKTGLLKLAPYFCLQASSEEVTSSPSHVIVTCPPCQDYTL